MVGYSNVGTVEFLLADDGQFYFIEMNTRIQVEHGVTEMVTSTDLVKESIRIAAGEPLRHQAAASRDRRRCDRVPDLRRGPGHASAVAGRGVSNHHSPGGLGVRVETALYDGYRVPVHYDPLIAKLIVHADTRASRSCGEAALREYVIDGIKTNIPLHLKILDDADFSAANSRRISSSATSARLTPPKPCAPQGAEPRAARVLAGAPPDRQTAAKLPIVRSRSGML